MPPQCWVLRLNSAASPGPAPMPVASSKPRALPICVSVTKRMNSAVAIPATAPAARPRQMKPLMPWLLMTGGDASVTGEAEGVAAVVEELVNGHPAVHEEAVLLQHDVGTEESEGHGQEGPDGHVDAGAGGSGGGGDRGHRSNPISRR